MGCRTYFKARVNGPWGGGPRAIPTRLHPTPFRGARSSVILKLCHLARAGALNTLTQTPFGRESGYAPPSPARYCYVGRPR
eukprot:scaffold107497_cov35-Tisochrysis_lutea.AAC.1